MKRLVILIALASTWIALMAPAVFGYSIKIYQNAYSYSNGGEFTVVSSDLNFVSGAYTGPNTQGVRESSLFNFETFCLEYNEEFNPGVTYYAEINSMNAAITGDSQQGYDVISQGTAWLYLQFISGTLQSYDYSDSAARKASAGILQQAIWFLEDEGQGSLDNYYVILASEHFGGNLELAKTNYTGTDVDVLNVWDDSSYNGLHQDQLIDPIGVPEPTTLLLMGLGLIGLGLSSRKFKK